MSLKQVTKSLDNRSISLDGQKVREGKVDGFKKILSAEDLGFIQRAIDRLGNPFETAIRNTTVGSIIVKGSLQSV